VSTEPAAAWDPRQYGRYADERSRPFHDLLARVRATDPRHVVDLGCGDGALTATLAARRPDADVAGVDSSAEMLATGDAARAAGVDLRQGRIQDWRPTRPVPFAPPPTPTSTYCWRDSRRRSRPAAS
jgi:trans-aconitate 2-methyltransferase